MSDGIYAENSICSQKYYEYHTAKNAVTSLTLIRLK